MEGQDCAEKTSISTRYYDKKVLAYLDSANRGFITFVLMEDIYMNTKSAFLSSWNCSDFFILERKRGKMNSSTARSYCAMNFPSIYLVSISAIKLIS